MQIFRQKNCRLEPIFDKDDDLQKCEIYKGTFTIYFRAANLIRDIFLSELKFYPNSQYSFRIVTR